MKARSILVALSLVCATVSCKSQFEMMLQSSDVDAKYAAAFQMFEAGKYNKAAQLFESLSVQTNGTEKDDTVLYYWGLSNYKFKDFYTAETNFEKFVTNYPRSPFASDARYLRIDCLYKQTLRYELDQSPTNRALSEIGLYLREYPETPHLEDCEAMIKDLHWRLDTKAFEGAKLYYRMEDYLASRVALVNVLKDNAENIYREDILYYTAMSSYKYAKLSVPQKQKERYLVFSDDYLNFVGEMPESKYRKELDVLYQRAQKALGRYTGEVNDTREKSFAKERKKLEKAGASEKSKESE
ncbi:MAG: outer membrane protein assembly factor BamD [Bacteroidales bacterium]|nr:outer membrane protein assembly factor BamD [Bacteroidales bacterium]